MLRGLGVRISKENRISLNDGFVFTNSLDPDEMSHAVFHQGLYCCQSTHLELTSIERAEC